MKYISFISCIFPKQKENVFNEFLSNIGTKYETKDVWNYANWNPPKEYIDEMGSPLITKTIVLKENYNIPEMVRLKKLLQITEANTSGDGKRTLNLNPGYLSGEGMFLLTHKPSEERGRKKLGEDVWQEKQYDFENGSFTTNKNTFSEYSNEGRLRLFNGLNKAK